METLNTIKDILKRKYDKLTQPGGALSFQYPPGYVPTQKYETKLNVLDEQNFKAWNIDRNQRRKEAGLFPDSGYDYDHRGLWKETVGHRPTQGTYNKSLDPNTHGTDKYKKPNHPTFSRESIYSGVDGYEGGKWGKRSFKPSKEMKKRTDRNMLQEYFKKHEQGTKLIWAEED